MQPCAKLFCDAASDCGGFASSYSAATRSSIDSQRNMSVAAAPAAAAGRSIWGLGRLLVRLTE
jgi:hypothetical protein